MGKRKNERNFTKDQLSQIHVDCQIATVIKHRERLLDNGKTLEEVQDILLNQSEGVEKEVEELYEKVIADPEALKLVSPQ